MVYATLPPPRYHRWLLPPHTFRGYHHHCYTCSTPCRITLHTTCGWITRYRFCTHLCLHLRCCGSHLRLLSVGLHGSTVGLLVPAVVGCYYAHRTPPHSLGYGCTFHLVYFSPHTVTFYWFAAVWLVAVNVYRVHLRLPHATFVLAFPRFTFCGCCYRAVLRLGYCGWLRCTVTALVATVLPYHTCGCRLRILRYIAVRWVTHCVPYVLPARFPRSPPHGYPPLPVCLFLIPRLLHTVVRLPTTFGSRLVIPPLPVTLVGLPLRFWLFYPHVYHTPVAVGLRFTFGLVYVTVTVVLLRYRRTRLYLVCHRWVHVLHLRLPRFCGSTAVLTCCGSPFMGCRFTFCRAALHLTVCVWLHAFTLRYLAHHTRLRLPHRARRAALPYRSVGYGSAGCHCPAHYAAYAFCGCLLVTTAPRSVPTCSACGSPPVTFTHAHLGSFILGYTASLPYLCTGCSSLPTAAGYGLRLRTAVCVYRARCRSFMPHYRTRGCGCSRFGCAVYTHYLPVVTCRTVLPVCGCRHVYVYTFWFSPRTVVRSARLVTRCSAVVAVCVYAFVCLRTHIPASTTPFSTLGLFVLILYVSAVGYCRLHFTFCGSRLRLRAFCGSTYTTTRLVRLRSFILVAGCCTRTHTVATALVYVTGRYRTHCGSACLLRLLPVPLPLGSAARFAVAVCRTTVPYRAVPLLPVWLPAATAVTPFCLPHACHAHTPRTLPDPTPHAVYCRDVVHLRLPTPATPPHCGYTPVVRSAVGSTAVRCRLPAVHRIYLVGCSCVTRLRVVLPFALVPWITWFAHAAAVHATFYTYATLPTFMPGSSCSCSTCLVRLVLRLPVTGCILVTRYGSLVAFALPAYTRLPSVGSTWITFTAHGSRLRCAPRSLLLRLYRLPAHTCTLPQFTPAFVPHLRLRGYLPAVGFTYPAAIYTPWFTGCLHGYTFYIPCLIVITLFIHRSRLLYAHTRLRSRFLRSTRLPVAAHVYAHVCVYVRGCLTRLGYGCHRLGYTVHVTHLVYGLVTRFTRGLPARCPRTLRVLLTFSHTPFAFTAAVAAFWLLRLRVAVYTRTPLHPALYYCYHTTVRFTHSRYHHTWFYIPGCVHAPGWFTLFYATRSHTV